MRKLGLGLVEAVMKIDFHEAIKIHSPPETYRLSTRAGRISRSAVRQLKSRFLFKPIRIIEVIIRLSITIYLTAAPPWQTYRRLFGKFSS